MKKKLYTLLALLMTVMGANAQEPTTYFVELTTDSKPEGASTSSMRWLPCLPVPKSPSP